MTRQRKRDMRRRQRRQRKIRLLRSRLAETTDLRERERIINKLKRIAPTASIPEG